MDPALRSNDEHLTNQRNAVLKELLKLEGYNHINIPHIGKTKVDTPSLDTTRREKEKGTS